MSDSATVDTGNDGDLASGKYITVNTSLDSTGTVARITPSDYSGNPKVLNGTAVADNYGDSRNLA